MEIDKSNLRQVILDSADQFSKGLELAEEIIIKKSFDTLVVSGMGGSALPADLMEIFAKAKKANLRVIANRFYHLPPEAYGNALNIVCSYSGNTEETLSSLEEAIEKKLEIVGISAGGKLEEICKTNNLPFVRLPGGIQPRIATGYFFGALYRILVNAKILSDETETMLELAGWLKSEQADLEKQGEGIAQKLFEKTPIIYSSERLGAIAKNWKIKINENAKTTAFWNFFPELNHNEMVGFTNPRAQYFVVMLQDPDDDPRNTKRFEVTRKLLSENKIESFTVSIPKEPIFYQIFWTLNLGDWTSYHLALKYGQDPEPVEMVEKFKELIK